MNILKSENYKVELTSWGSLTWFASKELDNSETMTVGKCTINPGQENPRHYHPNCEEVLHVLEGTIIHTVGDEEQIMNVGDTITIPANIPHNAKNIGESEAILFIVFSSGQRQTIGE